MKRLIVTLLLIGVCLGWSVHALAATPSSNWQVNISVPSNTTSKSFNVQYTTLSTEASDQITVTLFQNNVQFGTAQTTTKPFGDSGVFAVTVPSNGTYTYYLLANNSGDSNNPKTTSTVSVAVSDPPAGTTNTVFVNNGTNTGSTATNPANTGVNGASTTAPATTGNGQVSPGGSATTNNAAGVLGAETTTKKTSTAAKRWLSAGIGAGVLVLLGLLLLRRRARTNT